ncbi:hypothetical protein B9Z55_020415 [Caenorhabditis nigoni]|uniref:Uncharacterized protein n=1 Tax=Caenorhabditis nigoni TaxID=1611254 RepID=A0A2G5TN42_9PELO|nr:hypothetical protein B9Z55_020415 [Caenorhabditis nigoni]
MHFPLKTNKNAYCFRVQKRSKKDFWIRSQGTPQFHNYSPIPFNHQSKCRHPKREMSNHPFQLQNKSAGMQPVSCCPY